MNKDDLTFLASTRECSRLVLLNRASSTNDELRILANDSSVAETPTFSVVATLNQTEGRGRLGRQWRAPAGTSIAASVLLRETRDLGETAALVSLMAGLAMTRATRELGVESSLKWPNDVLVGGLKLSGILCERIDDDCLIVGAGLNVSFTVENAPVSTATSLAMQGVIVAPDEALAVFLRHLRRAWNRLRTDGPEATLVDVRAVCSTLGHLVSVELPDNSALRGTALEIDSSGRLVIEEGGQRTPVAAGDVTHLRY